MYWLAIILYFLWYHMKNKNNRYSIVMVVVLLSYRESASEPASWSASSPAQPLYHGSWPASCIPGETFLPNSQMFHFLSAFLLNVHLSFNYICELNV